MSQISPTNRLMAPIREFTCPPKRPVLALSWPRAAGSSAVAAQLAWPLDGPYWSVSCSTNPDPITSIAQVSPNWFPTCLQTAIINTDPIHIRKTPVKWTELESKHIPLHNSLNYPSDPVQSTARLDWIRHLSRQSMHDTLHAVLSLAGLCVCSWPGRLTGAGAASLHGRLTSLASFHSIFLRVRAAVGSIVVASAKPPPWIAKVCGHWWLIVKTRKATP